MLLSMTIWGNLNQVFSLILMFLKCLVMKNMVEYPTKDWAFPSIYMEKPKLQAILNNNCKTQLRTSKRTEERGHLLFPMWVNDLHLPMARCKYVLKSFFAHMQVLL